jgi:hypothetical protein
MAKMKNHVIYDNDQVTLTRLAEEYAMLGRDVKIEQGRLTVFAIPRRYRKYN